MTWYLWAIIHPNHTDISWKVTTDRNPTHDQRSKWVLVKEFTW